MTADEFLTAILRPALLRVGDVLPSPQAPAALRMLLAIAGQESAWAHRYQVLAAGQAGPARGWWQFERGGGVAVLLANPRTKPAALALCNACHVRPTSVDVWRALEGHDALAAGFARLLLWSDPAPLPGPGEQQTAWQYYLRNWRPGKPHPAKWPDYWEAACRALQTS